MNLDRTVLLVSPTPTLSTAVACSLRQTGYRLRVVKTYRGAKSQLSSAPHVLVTELKLGEYNGLQLALRSRVRGTRAVVVADKAFEAEIEQLGATWISPEAAFSGELPAVITRVLAAPVAAGEWYDRGPETSEPIGAFVTHQASVVH
jgi:CheY-like chemotaxis protein